MDCGLGRNFEGWIRVWVYRVKCLQNKRGWLLGEGLSKEGVGLPAGLVTSRKSKGSWWVTAA